MTVRRPQVPRALVAAVLLTLVAGLGCSDDGPPDPAKEARGLVAVADRKLAPALRGVDLQGQPVDTARLRGTPLVLNVWGSWCAPCKLEQPELTRVATETAAQGVRFLGIAVRDTKTGALAHVDRFDVPYSSLFDADSRLVARLSVLPANAVPSTLVLDREGRIAVVLIGATTHDELAGLLAKVLAEAGS